MNPGDTLGQYRILDKLGAGGMGEVYRARDTKLGREVAIKVLPAAFTDDAERRERFEREARAASALSHPNVATIYEFGESEGRAFIAMELVDGQSLTARIAGHPLATRDLVDLALQVADALEEAHGRGITHRDIKPGNLMVTPRGRVKVLDFGLARLAPHDADGDASTLMATRAGTALGTVPYMSPEQAMGRDVDPRSDLFSLGAVIYEMATGRRAFDSGSASATTDLILHSQPMAIARLNYDVPEELDRIVRKCLEKDRERRYQSARELVVDLGTLKRDLESGSGVAALRTPADGSPAAAPGSHVSTVPPSAPQASSSLASGAAAAAQPPSSAASGAPAAAAWRRRRVVVAAGVALLVLAAAVAGIEWYRTSRATPGGPSSAGAPSGLTIRSLAVLPLANLSHDPDQLYFVDGMHDELISRLSKISGILVKNRASSLRYRDSSKPPAEIGRELGVDGLISGSVSRASNRVAIRVQLVRATTEDNVWADTYQRDLTDVLGLQAEVAQAIVQAIGVVLKPAEQKTLAASRPVNPAAYEAYLRGRHLLNTYWDEAHITEARRWSERAIELDPMFARAYTNLGSAYFILGQIGTIARLDSLVQAEAQGRKAYELDPTPEAEYAMVNPRGLRTFEWRRSMDIALKWLAADPNSAQAHYVIGTYYMLAFDDRIDDAIAELRKAVELDPFVVEFDETLGEAFIYARRYDEALRHAEGFASRHKDPKEAANQAAWLRAMIYAATGDNARAIAEARKVAAAWPEQWSLVAPIYAKAGNTSEARQLIRLDEQKYKAGRPVDAANIALTYLYLGETDKVFGWLDRAFDDYDWGLVFLRNPMWDPVRKDPRFQQVVRRRFGEPSAK